MSSKRLIRWVALPAGLLVFAVGAIMFPLPIPIGLVLMIVGLAIAAMNPLVMRWIKRTRKRFPRINHKIRGVTPMMPKVIQRFLTRTDSRKKGTEA